MKVAIDGPAGAGKSTIARLLADELNLIYIDTGAMYRALTWKALQYNIGLDDVDGLCNLALHTHFHFLIVQDKQRIFCDQLDVSDEIRTPEINGQVSRLAAHSPLRAIMVEKQQRMADDEGVVMDGRDVGECILPSADYKFFLTASLKCRAERRLAEMKEQGYEPDLAQVEVMLRKRDEDDSKREKGALKILEDSIVIDTSGLSIEEVLKKILLIIEEGDSALPDN